MPFISASAISPYNSIRVGSDLVRPFYDSDYQSVLDYATTQGYTLPSGAQQIIQNQLVIALKADGIWSKLDSFSVFATDGDSDYALIDWIRLSTQTAINSPTFISNVGYQGNNVNAEIRTGYNPDGSLNYKQDSASYGVYVNEIVTDGQYLMGAGSVRCRMRTINSSNNFINSLNISAAYNFGGVGFSHFNRSSSTNVQCIKNGISSDRTATSSGLPNEFIYLAYEAGIGNSDAKISIGFIGGDLSSQASQFNTSINNYLAAI